MNKPLAMGSEMFGEMPNFDNMDESMESLKNRQVSAVLIISFRVFNSMMTILDSATTGKLKKCGAAAIAPLLLHRHLATNLILPIPAAFHLAGYLPDAEGSDSQCKS